MDKNKSIQPYKSGGVQQSNVTNAIASAVLYADQGKAFVEAKVYEANIRGKIWQIEADVILEYELGLGPRIKKWW